MPQIYPTLHYSITRRLTNLLPLVLFLGAFMASQTLFAQTTFAYLGGNRLWTDPAAWAKSGAATAALYPGAVAGETHDVTIDSSVVQINAGLTSNSIRTVTVAGPGTLSILAATSFSNAASVLGGAGTVQIEAPFTTAGSYTPATTVSAAGATLSFAKNVASTSASGNVALIFTGSTTQTLALTGSWASLTSTSGTLTASGSYTLTSALSLNGNYTHTSGIVTFTGNSFAGTGTLVFPTLAFNSASTISSTVSATVKGDLSNNGAALAFTAGRLTFDKGNVMAISGSGTISLFNMTVGGTANSYLNINRNLVVTGTATGATATTAAIGVNSLANNVLNLAAGVTLTVQGTNATILSNNRFDGASTSVFLMDAAGITLKDATTFTNLTLATGRAFTTDQSVSLKYGFTTNASASFTQTAGTFTLTGAGQSFGGTGTGPVFNNFTANGSGIKTLSLPITVNGNMSIGTGVTVNVSTNDLILKGDYTSAGTLLQAGSSKVLMAGTIAQNMSGTLGFRNLTVSNTTATVSAANAMTVSVATSIPSGATLLVQGIAGNALGTVTGTGTLQITAAASANTVFPGGTFTGFLYPGTGMVEYTGNVSYNIYDVPPVNYYNFKVSGTGVKTLTQAIEIQNDLTIAAGATLNGGSVNITLYKGNINNSGTFDGGSNGDVRFSNTTAAQTLSGSGSYSFQQLTMAKNGQAVTMAAPIRVVNRLNFETDGFLDLGTNDLTLSAGASILTNTTFGTACMIRQNGSTSGGAVIREGTTTAQFISVLPIGTGSVYAPAQFTQLTATITGTATIAVRTIPFTTVQNHILKRFWRINTTNISAITNARFTFTYPASEVVGTPDGVVRQDNLGNQFTPTGYFYDGISKFGISSSGNTFLEQDWYFERQDLPVIYYSFASGNYSDPNTWTTDYNGVLQTNPPDVGGPDANDKIVILTGKTVTMDVNNTSPDSVQIRTGGRLAIGTTTGHDFGKVEGQGTLATSMSVLPTATYTSFVAAGGGTIEWTNFSGNIDPAFNTFNNLSFTGTGTKIISATATRNITVNGSLNVKNTSGLTLGSAAFAVNLTITGDFNTDAGTTVRVGTSNIGHSVKIAGNMTSAGDVRFHNLTSGPTLTHLTTLTTTGYATVEFFGTANSVVTLTSAEASFYFLRVNKNVLATTVTINPDRRSHFSLYGQNNQADAGVTVAASLCTKALRPDVGTLVLGDSVLIASLTEGGGMFRIGYLAELQVRGKVTVTTSSTTTGQSEIAPYGILRVKKGTLLGGTGFGVRMIYTGKFIMDTLGTATISQLSTYRAATGIGTPAGAFEAYLNSTLTVDGSGQTDLNFARFDLLWSGIACRIYGGTFNIYKPVGTPASVMKDGGIRINGTMTTTGGTWNLYLPAVADANQDFGINVSGGLWAVNMYNQGTYTTSEFLCTAMPYNDNGSSGTVGIRALTVYNTLTQNAYASLNVASLTFQVGSDWTTAPTAKYNPGTTLTQVTRIGQGLAGQTTVININWQHASPRFNIIDFNNNASGGSFNFTGNDFYADSSLRCIAGTINHNNVLFYTYKNYDDRVTHNGPGRTIMLGTANASILSGGTSFELEIRKTPTAGIYPTVTLGSSNYNVKYKLVLTSGILETSAYALLMANGSRIINGAGDSAQSAFGPTNMITTNGGRQLRRYLNAGQRSLVWPIGTGTSAGGNLKYRPVLVSVTSATSYGYADYTAFNSQHPNITLPPATANDALNYFWKEGSSGWGTITGLNVTFVYNAGDIPPSGNATDDNTYVMGRYIYATPNYWNNNAYATQNSDVASKNYFGNGDYTVGNVVAFGGLIEYWARVSGSWGRPSTWRRKQNGIWLDNTPAWSATAPIAGSAVVIPDNITITIKDSVPTISLITTNLQGANTVLEMDTTLSKWAHDFGTVLATNAKINISYGKLGVRPPGGNWTALWAANYTNIITFYRKGYDFTIPKRWTNTYRLLNIRPDGGNIYLPDTALTTNGTSDFSVTATPGKIYLSSAPSADVTLGGATTIGTNTQLIFPATVARTFKQNSGNLTLNGDIKTDTLAGNNVIHRLELRYNITCATGSSFDLQPGSLNVARGYIYWNNNSTAFLQGTPTIFRLWQLYVNKNSGIVGEVTVSNFHLKGDASLALASKPIYITSGTLRINTLQSATGGIYYLNSGTNPSADFKIPSAAALEMYQGNYRINATGTNAGLTLEGRLNLQPGTKLVIKSDAATDSYLQLSTSAGTPTLEMNADSLVIGGQYRSMSAGTARACSLTVTRGVFMVGLVNAPVTTRAMFEVANTSSYALISGGKIIICRSSTFNPEFQLNQSSGGVTGGLLQVGYSNSPSGTVIRTNGTVVPGLYVCGTTAGAVKPVASYTAGPVYFMGDVTTDAGTNLNVVNDSYFSGDFINYGTYNGAAYKAIFNGVGRDQDLVSPTGFTTTSFTYTPSLATSQLTLTMSGGSLNTTDFDIDRGTVNAGSVNIVVTGNVSNDGTHSSTTGVLKVTSAGATIATFSNGLTAAYGNVEIDRNAAAIGNMSLAGNLVLTKGVFDIDTSYLYLGQNSGIVNGNAGLVYSGTKCIRTAGRVQDGGINKAFPSGAFSLTVPLAIGATSPYSYVPATYNATTNTAPGNLAVKPVNRPHPATTDASNRELAFYWSVSATGFAGLNVTHTYTYLQTMQNGRGTEASYIPSRYTGSWITGIGTIATGANVITINGTGTGVSYLDGDFTAGEFTEFSNGATYLSNGTGGGNWNVAASWMGAAIPPSGAQVRIQLHDVIVAVANNLSQSTLTIDTNATLNLAATTGHDLGTVYGQGTLALSTGTFPAGNFGTFSNAGGGTVEYNGAGYTIASTRSVYNHLRINATGTIDMANLATTVNGDLTVTAGTFRNLNNKKLIVRGNVTNGATFIAGSASTNENLELYGDFTNNGTFTAGNTVTIFRGSTVQKVKGSTAPFFSTLQINKPTEHLWLQQSITVGKQVTMTKGILRLFDADLNMWDTTTFKPDVMTSASYVDAHRNGMIKKKLTMTASPAAANLRIFPVGDSLNYTPITAKINSVTIGASGSLNINVAKGGHPLRASANRFLKRYWRVQNTNLSNASMDLTYTYTGASEIQDNYPIDPRPITSAVYSGGEWTANPAGGYDPTNNQFSYLTTGRFGDYTGGTGMGDAVPLPVSLSSLEATPGPQGVTVTWTTLTETSSDGFGIERSTDGGKTFQRIGYVSTKAVGGESKTKLAYQYLDKVPHSGTNLYRLAQQDRDGEVNRTHTVQVYWEGTRLPKYLTVAPNPSDGKVIKAMFGGLMEGTTTATVTDAMGQVVWQGELEVGSRGELDLASRARFTMGVYILTLSNSEERMQIRFVVR